MCFYWFQSFFPGEHQIPFEQEKKHKINQTKIIRPTGALEFC